MSMKLTDPFAIGRQRVKLVDTGTAIMARSPERPGDVLDLLMELWNLCERYHRDFALYVALCVNETNWFTHIWWKLYRNPASIGVTGVASQDAESPRFASAKDAARFLFLLVEIKMQREILPQLAGYAKIAQAKADETLAYAKYDDFPQVRTLGDLNKKFGGPNHTQECVWMCAADGPASVIEKAAAIWPQLPDREETKMGKVPYPPFVDRPLPEKFGNGMSWLPRWNAQGLAVASWWHTMEGWLWSTDTYFRLPSVGACTDWGIGGAGDGDSDGVIFRWLDAKARPFDSPWASGWSNHPDFDDQGQEFYDLFGPAGVNPLGRAIEFSGLTSTPMTAKQWASGIWLTAAIHSREIGQGWEEFAWNMQHYEVAEKPCPTKRIIMFTKQYQAGIVLIMRHYETGRDIPDFIEINGLQVPLAGGQDDDGVITPPPAGPIFIPFPEKSGRVFVTEKGALSRQWSIRSSDKVREYAENTRLRCTGYYHGEEVNGDDKWFAIKSSGPSNNARIHASGLKNEYVDPGLPTLPKVAA